MNLRKHPSFPDFTLNQPQWFLWATLILPTGLSCDSEPQSSHDITTSHRSGTTDTLLNPIADAHIRSAPSHKNYGGASSMELRNNGSRKILLRFDTNAINSALSGQNLIDAQLELTMDGQATGPWTGQDQLAIHRINQDWQESTVTWNSFGSSWDASVIDSTTITQGQNGSIVFDLTNEVTSMAQGGNHFGWVIIHSGSNGQVSTESRESTANPPILRLSTSPTQSSSNMIGQEKSIASHMADGDEFVVPMAQLLEHGEALFSAVWTNQEGGGRPLSKGSGAPLSDLARALLFPHNFNRISAPDSNSCAGCHNHPFGVPGGGGDIVTNVFVLAERFDFLTFDPTDLVPTRGAVDELGNPVTFQNVSNSRSTLGMFGSGYIEMLTRQITTDLQSQRDTIAAGQSLALQSKGISFGTLSRDAGGNWDTNLVEGLPGPSLSSSGPFSPPSLIIRPFHQSGAVISLRQFANNAFNHHHGMQSTERFGSGTDPDGDSFTDELTRADITAISMFQATMAVPGHVIPNDPAVEDAVLLGEASFHDFGCTDCHIPSLPLDNSGWLFSEPNIFNPPGNLQLGQAPTLTVDLNDSASFPSPRLMANAGIVHVPAFTDFKLHDITSGASDPNAEFLDMNEVAGSASFFAGNRKFLTRKLWGVANEPPYFHHGMFTTMREAILAHFGEANTSRLSFVNAPTEEQDALIEYLKTFQVLPPGTSARIVDENFQPRTWPQ